MADEGNVLEKGKVKERTEIRLTVDDCIDGMRSARRVEGKEN